MNGQVLCNLGKERFLELAPDFVGDILWEHLEQMIKGTHRGTGRLAVGESRGREGRWRICALQSYGRGFRLCGARSPENATE